MTRRARLAWLAAAVAAVLILFAGGAAYRRYLTQYTVTRDNQGDAVARVVAVAFEGRSVLEVARISGTLQTTAQDTRGFGLLSSDYVMKAPFSVEYSVDVSRLSRRDVRWDAASRTLTLDVPEVTTGQPNIDEAHATLVATRGLFVTRGAGETLSRKASVKADALARGEAAKPQFVGAARENARRDLAHLLAVPLAAAGVGGASVRVRFPDEVGTAPAAGEAMDRSRSLAQVFGERR
jgi:hypothetical protein